MQPEVEKLKKLYKFYKTGPYSKLGIEYKPWVSTEKLYSEGLKANLGQHRSIWSK